MSAVDMSVFDMGKGRERLKAGKKKLPISAAALVLLFLAVFAADRLGLRPAEPAAPALSGSTEESLFVHYIDVGQGDCELIQAPGGNMLIDTGEYEYADKVVAYLEAHDVEYIDVLVATHPHSDHIGGMAAIINDFGVGSVVMPRASNNGLAYEKMLTAMKDRGLKAHAPAVGEAFSLGDAGFTVLAPSSAEYESLNNYSVVLRMTYGRHSFLFTGDAESVSEREMVGNGLEPADFLKVGHHGSRTSSSESFLNAVRPKLAFISMEKGNSYGHPHQDVIDRLLAYGAEIYRTDRNGTIVVETDGERYRIITEE